MFQILTIFLSFKGLHFKYHKYILKKGGGVSNASPHSPPPTRYFDWKFFKLKKRRIKDPRPRGACTSKNVNFSSMGSGCRPRQGVEAGEKARRKAPPHPELRGGWGAETTPRGPRGPQRPGRTWGAALAPTRR